MVCDALAKSQYAVQQGAPRLGTRQRLSIVFAGVRDALRGNPILEPGLADPEELAEPGAPHGA
jgi:hypothetical protein